MTAQILDVAKRVKTLNAVLNNEPMERNIDKALQDAEGNWDVALEKLKGEIAEDSLKKVVLANSLADWSDDHIPLVKAIAAEADLTSLRDVALRFNVEKLTEQVDPRDLPETVAGASEGDRKKNFAIFLQHKLFAAETSAVLQRMVQDAEVPIANAEQRASVATFLANQPEFNIRKTSIYKALQNPEAFKDIAEEQRAGVIEQLKTLQRVQALTSAPEAVPVLMSAYLTSALSVSELPESTFLRTFSQDLGEATARQVYTNAINTQIRNEHALMTLHETARGAGLAVMDGDYETRQNPVKVFRIVIEDQGIPLSLENLFGDMDYCECDECQSVYSPAAYFVDLLQFLRNNNLDPDKANTGQPGIENTPLEVLFRRRPDLGCLELTCENTFTVLPYVDLVNEVMESFVVHLKEYSADQSEPKQTLLETFNVEDETSSELLAQPQHTNYQAYCILKSEVYPFILPYHQPIDSARILLKHLGTSRHELLDTFRTPSACVVTEQSKVSSEDQAKLNELHNEILDRAVDSEALGLTQEEYIHLTKEAFWPKEYFDITLNKEYDIEEYQTQIGVKSVCKYYGYESNEDMLCLDEDEQKGLTFVKKQFIPRTGIQYVDLVELLKTRCINPNFPQGKALQILESIRFSYRFLQFLDDTNKENSRDRFAKVIAFLDIVQPWAQLADALLHPDPCQQQSVDWCPEAQDFRNWVYCYFERLGGVIVLESGEGPRLPIHGDLYAESDTGARGVEAKVYPPGQEEESKEDRSNELIKRREDERSPTPDDGRVGTLHQDGKITDTNGEAIGFVGLFPVYDDKSRGFAANAAPVLSLNLKLFFADKDYRDLDVRDPEGNKIGVLENDGLKGDDYETTLQWLHSQDTCDLEKVRLRHLNGTSLTSDEYDCIQRFIRLWRNMGWTIDETDKALVGLTGRSEDSGETPALPAECDYTGFDAFVDSCSKTDEGDRICEVDEGIETDWQCPDFPEIFCAITPDFIHQLVAVRRLLDLTGLPLARLLTFWAGISTAGENSLYSRLFLTHNLLGIDKVFQADADGNYLTESEKITDHLPVLMAALRVKAEDIKAVMDFRELSDALTLQNVSALYRHSLLAKALGVKVNDLPQLVALFGEPCTKAYETLALFETWGKMEDAGFSFHQLNYLIRDQDDPLRPLAPTKRSVLQTTKSLYDGLNAIDSEHPDIDEDAVDQAKAELVRAKTGLLFEQVVVEQILGLLEGSSLYANNAPAGLTIEIPEALARKLRYADPKDATSTQATIQVTGILTEDEMAQAKGLSTHPDWAKAVDCANKQAGNFFNDALFGIFPDSDAARVVLLAGDVVVPSEQQDPKLPDPNTAPRKRLYFLRHFLPFLRRWLAHRLIIETMSGSAGLPSDITDILLSDFLTVGDTSEKAIAALERIKAEPAEGDAGWKGYLIPTVDDAYTFSVVGDTQPTRLLLDGQWIEFSFNGDDCYPEWTSDPVKLRSGRLYWLEISGQPASALQWKTATSPRAGIPASSLLPDYSARGTEAVFAKLAKAALLINGFNLSAEEVSYWQSHGDDFADVDSNRFDFNAVKLQHWLRLQAYTSLRDRLPKTELGLSGLFQWACQQADASMLSEKIAAATGWEQEDIDKLIAANRFALNDLQAFRNEINLVKLEKALQIAAKIEVDIDQLFDWARPTSKFWECHRIAQDISKALRARYDQEDWEQVVKPLNDQLRENQKNALISYLLVQPDLIDWGVVDADSLFEFFLIDVQMDPCFETSRIKQAISSVQLFVQRCMLGLEKDQNNEVIVLDRQRWDWMQRYRVWEANRKVFLYPENWIASQLRDDKSPFYTELESELLQKDIDKRTVEDAVKSYLYKVDEVANMRVVGLFVEQATDENGNLISEDYIKLHVLARTRNAPYFFYYRYFDINEGNWYPWNKVQVDIPSYDYEGTSDINKRFTENGAYLIPVVWRKRLLIFLPQFMKKTEPVSHDGNFKQMGENENVEDSKPNEYWEIKMGWSEYRNGKWTQKQLSTQAVYSDDDSSKEVPDIGSYEFIPRIYEENENGSRIVIGIHLDAMLANSFQFSGSQLSVAEDLVDFKTDIGFRFHWRPYLTILDYIPSFQVGGNTEHNPQSGDGLHTFIRESPPIFLPKIYQNGSIDNSYIFYHPFIHELLGKLSASGLDDLFEHFQELSTSAEGTPEANANTYGTDGCDGYHELKRPYSLYNWEAAFHAPMLLVESLIESQQFEQALKMCHYVFDPLANSNGEKTEKRFWNFVPFKETDAKKVLEDLFASLQAGEKCTMDAVNEWREKPFMPHVVARSRPSAYMKWVVMKYLEILIAWGDYLCCVGSPLTQPVGDSLARKGVVKRFAEPFRSERGPRRLEAERRDRCWWKRKGEQGGVRLGAEKKDHG